MIREAFRQAFAIHANDVVVGVLILVAALVVIGIAFLLDKLFGKSFKQVLQGIFDEVAKVGQKDTRMSSLNLVGGVFGVVFFALYIGGAEIIQAIMRLIGESSESTFPIFLTAALSTWGYFLLSIVTCSFFNRQR